MSNLISRQAAIDAIEKAYFKGVAIDAVNNLPSVEPKKGKWIMADEPKKIGRIVLEPLDIRKCSVCGEEPVYDEGEAVLTDFCPNCGADMRGEEE